MPMLYDEDLVCWAARQAGLLRDGKLDELDHDRVAGELRGIAAAERTLLTAALTEAMVNIARCRVMPDNPKVAVWTLHLGRARDMAQARLARSPSLCDEVADIIRQALPAVRRMVFAMGDGAAEDAGALVLTEADVLGKDDCP